MITIADIIDTLSNNHVVWRTLHGVEIPLRDGRPHYTVGNAAVSLRVRLDGRDAWLKCYTRPNGNLQAVYGEALRRRELCVFALGGRRQWVDCLVSDYIEGETLDTILGREDARQHIGRIACAFDEAALALLRSERAHGDLKPENMIVTAHDGVELIDWDSAYTPLLAGRVAPETGTAAYQHPARTIAMFDKHIDDYPIALLSVMLHAAAIDPSIAERYRTLREFPIHPRHIAAGATAEVNRVADLFASRGMAAEYRMTRMLLSPTPYLFDLERTLDAACQLRRTASAPLPEAESAAPELDQCDGLWGYRTGGEWTIPPMYDWGFDPSEGTMLVGLGGYSHLLLRNGLVAASFPRGSTVKPLRDGRTTVRETDGSCRTFDLSSHLGWRG